MLIPAVLLDDILAHAREEYDAECCGMVAYDLAADDGAQGEKARRFPARGARGSAQRVAVSVGAAAEH